MTPKEKTEELLKAMQFCKEKKLLRPGELEQAKTKEEMYKLACKAVLRMELHQKTYPEET